MKNGDIFRNPPAFHVSCIASISGNPPSPTPRFTPMRSASSVARCASSPESAYASIAAPTPRCVKRPNFFRSFCVSACVSGSLLAPRGCKGVGKSRAGSKFFTSPAIRAVQPVASNRVIGPIPLRPAMSAAHVSGAEFPQGVTAPMPVTTTRRRGGVINELLIKKCSQTA